MSDLAVINGGSPFDRIRQVRAEGSEFWSARDLMPLMGYGTWERFKNPLDRAIKSAQNQIGDLTSDFRRSAKVSGERGPAQQDFELSRFAAYLVAMNGDPNKPEVAAAQAYFAIRTREAETRPALNQFDVLRSAIDQIEAAQREASEAKAIAERTDARLAAIEGKHDWFAALGYARLNQLPTSSPFLAKLGKCASRIARSHHVKPNPVPHQLYGTVNSYPAWIWDLAAEGFTE